MPKRRICLFTAHSPASGGGGAILRSLVENMPHIDVIWCYTGSKVVGYEAGHLGEGIMGGNILKDIASTYKMLSGFNSVSLNKLVDKLLAVSCDAYWIVSHNEGLRVALELALHQQQRPVHLTVHDDWAGALSARSVRYRLLAGPAQKLTIKTLNSVASFDVISKGMQAYYSQIAGKTGNICHRYLLVDSLHITHLPNRGEVYIGHIGSLYNVKSLIDLITLLRKYFEPKGKKPVVKLWGCHITGESMPADLRDYTVFYPTASEAEVVPELANCDLLYAMYPLGKSLEIFAQTSLPTKLTSYLQAGRPILAHCAKTSTLAEYIDTTGLGVVWPSDNEAEGIAAIEKLSSLNITLQLALKARELYFGERNLEVMNDYFMNGDTKTA
ncbi:hypothetical protein ACFQZS_11535 [Mucilaginibacter calamicampi]|uniref:Uncharacterized protein n=1 Tax=Mucilaginibacter calamicampi TaxID=1302352 RepID=A0ABW2YYS9_9SPHI